MKKIKGTSLANWWVRSICYLFLVAVIGCNSSDKPKVENIVNENVVNKVKQCPENQRIDRRSFSLIMEKYLSRNPDPNFYYALSLDQLKIYWIFSFSLFTIFNEDLTACVVESSGTITEEKWTREGVEKVIIFLRFLTDIILHKGIPGWFYVNDLTRLLSEIQ
ncbi:MAG: hypothetical protein K1X29_10920 [Bdellovibrionales bacterium]|nr:hypothetical protein [Bdellovibrionales bacterium]